MESFVFEQQVLFRFDFLYGFKPKGSVSQDGARGQNLEHVRFFFLLWIHMDSFVFKQQFLFNVDFHYVTLDHRVQCPRVG